MVNKKYLEKVREINCVLCRFLEISNQTPAEIHHIEAVRDKYSDFAVVPLCTEHHRGKNGVHGLSRKGFESRYKLTQIDLLALTNFYKEKDEI